MDTWIICVKVHAFPLVQGFVMSGISNDVTYNLRKDISKKIQQTASELFMRAEQTVRSSPVSPMMWILCR